MSFCVSTPWIVMQVSVPKTALCMLDQYFLHPCGSILYLNYQAHRIKCILKLFNIYTIFLFISFFYKKKTKEKKKILKPIKSN